MTWTRTDLLSLALVLPILFALLILAFARRRRRVARALGEAHLLRKLGAGDLERFPHARLVLLVLAGAALGLAAAGPRWPRTGLSSRGGRSRTRRA